MKTKIITYWVEAELLGVIINRKSFSETEKKDARLFFNKTVKRGMYTSVKLIETIVTNETLVEASGK